MTSHEKVGHSYSPRPEEKGAGAEPKAAKAQAPPEPAATVQPYVPATLPVTTKCPTCGLVATGNLATEPGAYPIGGNPAPPIPATQLTPYPVKDGWFGRWLLLLCVNTAHRNIWNESNLAALNVTATPWVPIV